MAGCGSWCVEVPNRLITRARYAKNRWGCGKARVSGPGGKATKEPPLQIQKRGEGHRWKMDHRENSMGRIAAIIRNTGGRNLMVRKSPRGNEKRGTEMLVHEEMQWQIKEMTSREILSKGGGKKSS